MRKGCISVFVFQLTRDLLGDRRFAGILNKSNNSNESNKSYTLRGALFCDGANTLTVPTDVVVRVVAAAIEVQDTSVEGVRRTERTRPVDTVLTLEVPISTVAPASSREEDTVAVRTSNLITFMTALGCPSPIAFCTEFVHLCFGWHAPRTAPVGSCSMILRIARYIVWQICYICIVIAAPKV